VYTTASVALTPTDGTDSGSGVDVTTRVYQRDEATMTNGVCGTFANTWAATVSNPDTTVLTGKCYRYRLLEKDRVGNTSAASAATASARIILDDAAAPVNAFAITSATGGVYFTSPGGTAGTVYYLGSAAGSFRVTDTATDAGSGVAGVTYPLVSTPAWTHAVETVSTGPAYTSSTYSWTAGATTSPGAQAIVAQDLAGIATAGSPLTFTNDSTAPTTPSVALTSPPSVYTTASVALTPTDGTDAGSGVDVTTRVYQRDETAVTNEVCGTFPDTWAATVSNPDTTVQSGKCYRYRLLEKDRVGNQSAPSAATAVARVDLGGPPPDTTITSQPANPSNDPYPSFAFTSTAQGSFQCAIDGATPAPCSAPYGVDALGDGGHTFSVAAVNASGVADPTPATYTWSIDTTGDQLTVDEAHYTYTSGTSVAFDWRGKPADLRYGLTPSYGSTVTGHMPIPLPFSSTGPFRQVELTGLQAGTTYHYSIGGGADHTFSTAPTGTFRFDVMSDVGSSLNSSALAPEMSRMAGDAPAFVLAPGDLTYANVDTQPAADQHFNDVMAWSLSAAYMPAWGNHEWDRAQDDLRNYKGRFKLPNGQAAVDAPALGCCGDDWGWFDVADVRFISYPEAYTTATMTAWQQAVDPIFAAAQADPSIHYIITFGHRPAYSDGLHAGEQPLASILDGFGDRYNKYVLNLNGHSHDYERFQPIHGVTHITVGNTGSLEPPWLTTDPRTAFRAMHRGHLRVDVGPDGMRIEEVCGAATSTGDDMTCTAGTVFDSLTIGTPPPPPNYGPTLYVDNGNPFCTDNGSGTQLQPFCTISAAASHAGAGQTVQVASGTYHETVSVSASGTAQSPVVITSAPGANVVVTGGSSGFLVSGANWVTINGFTVTATTGQGILVQNSTAVTISNNHVSYAGQPVSGQSRSGIYCSASSSSIISGNDVEHNTSYGIYLTGCSNVLVKGNTSAYNAFGWQRAASGIRLYRSVANTVTQNFAHDNEDSGIEFDGGANNNLTLENVTWNNGDHGIDDLASPGQRIIGNSVYKNVAAGINVEGNSTDATIRNNVSVDNGIGSPRTRSDIRIENGSTTGTTMDYDLTYLTTPDTLVIWASVSYTSLAAFQTATGQEQHGLAADPKWVNAAGGDFRLTPGSPAIDSADSGNPDESATDVLGNPRVDDPATTNTGAGPRGFDDRGAYEYQALSIDHLTLAPATATIVSGDSRSYTVQATDTGGTSFDVTASSTLTIAPDGSCAGATCTATLIGPHTVTASFGGKSATASLDVTTSTVDHITISPTSSTIPAGGAQPYTVQAFDAGGDAVDATSAATFSITPDGSCTANSCTASTGRVHTVTASYSGKTVQAALQIDLVRNGGFETDLTGWNVSGSDATIVLDRVAGGHSGGFAARVSNTGATTGAFGVLQDAPNWAATTVADTYTASIWVRADAAGSIFRLKLQEFSGVTFVGSTVTQTTLSTGWQKVTVTYMVASPGTTLDFQAYVVNPAPGVDYYADDASLLVGVGGSAFVPTIVVSPKSTSITAGGTATFTTEGFDSGGGSVGDVTGATTFTITPDGTCTSNVCTATTGGTHTVHAAYGGATDSATLTVGAAALDHLTLSPATAAVATGQGQTYTATGRDQYGNSTGDLTASTTFSIAPDGSCASNVCSATVAGQHTVTGTSGTATGTASLDVSQPTGPLDHMVVSPGTAAIAAGAAQPYTVEGFDASNTSLGDVTSSTTFSIAPDGSCTGASCTATTAGPHTVTASDGAVSATATLTVTAAALDHLVLAPASASIAPGGSQAYTAAGSDQYGNSIGDVTSSTTFSISPNGSCTGASCTATQSGAHTVTATSSGKTGSATLQVSAGPLSSIVVSPAASTIVAGASQSYTVSGYDSDGNPIGDVTAQTTFSIAPDGSCTGAACTATAAGPHTVTANDGGKTTTATLTVTAGSLDHLVLAPASASIPSGGAQAFTAAGSDQYGNSLGDVTPTSAFSISPDGSCTGSTCTATASGAHTVTATKSGATGTATLQVTSAALDHITISPTSATITAGGSQVYTVQAVDGGGTSLGDVTSGSSFSIAPDGSCTANSCTASTGGVHTVTATYSGKTAQASLQINLIGNDGFETDLTGWNTSGSGANIVLERVAGGHSGGFAARVSNTGATASTYGVLQDSPNWLGTTLAGTYTASIWVRADTAGGVFKLKIQEYSGSTLRGSNVAQVTLTTAWQQVTVTYTVIAPGSTLDFQSYLTSPPPGVDFYADDASLTLG